MATHSSALAWRIPWTEDGGLQSTGSQRVGHNLAAKQQQMHIAPFPPNPSPRAKLVGDMVG